jgi:hypothetical protein
MKPKDPRKVIAKPSRPKTGSAAAKNKIAPVAKSMPKGSVGTAAIKRASVKPSPKPSNSSSKLNNLNAQGKPKMGLTRGSRDTGQVGNDNMRENYNASKDSKMPRTKQLSSYKKDGGASRSFMRRGGKGK